jgi:enamine deaminase RidA (YjgF/YER057c/UK114 family)
MKQNKTTVGTGTVWEELAGYSRAVRIGERILVSGTTATGPDGQVVGKGNAAAQARFILDKIERAIQQLGGALVDVVRTRVYVRHLEDWEAVARVHGERFAAIRPANTLVEARLVGDDYLVEIEAEAVVGAGGAANLS